MSLMTGSTTLTALRKKYNDFTNPSLEIIIDGKRMVMTKKSMIQQLSVDLTSGYEASGCEFVISGCYDYQKKDFDSSIELPLQVGAKAEILIGYQSKKESVFTGYIDTVSWEFSEDMSPSIRVRCMDAKGLLMKNRRLEEFRQTKPDAVVSYLLSQQPVRTYLTGKSVDMCSKEEVPLRAGMLTDYEIICQQAQKMGFEFFIIDGKAYFQEIEKNKLPIMTLEPEAGIQSLTSSVSGNTLVNEVEVRAIDDKKGKLIKGNARLTGRFSKGSTANRIKVSTTQVFYEAGVESAMEAKKRAKVRIDAMKSGFGSLEITCMGIPELVPGRFVKIDGFADAINDKYYITAVTHDLTDTYFTTTIRGRRDSIK